jgi:hypothetical protein
MKTCYALFLSAMTIAWLTSPSAAGIAGYYVMNLAAGDNLAAYTLKAEHDLLSEIVLDNTPNSLATGTVASLWDPQSRTYTQTSVFTSGAWSVDFTVGLGQGILLNAPTACKALFVGTVCDFDGSPDTLPSPTPPPSFVGQDGIFLLSDKAPCSLGQGGYGPVFTYVLGRDARIGEQFTWLDATAQTYHTTNYTASGWDNGEPSLAVGQSAFFNIGPVPEPTTLALLAIGGMAILRRKRVTR